MQIVSAKGQAQEAMINLARDLGLGIAADPDDIRKAIAQKIENMRGVAADEIDRLRAEVQRLTEEARRSDAGRVEVPEIGALLLERIEVRSKGYGEMAAMLNDWIKTNSRLSPSPQPSADVVVVPEIPEDWVRVSRYRMQTLGHRTYAWVDPEEVARKASLRLSPSPQPATGAAELASDEWRRAGLTPQQMWEEIQEIRELVGCDGTHGSPRDAVARKLDILRHAPQPSADVVVVPREEYRALESVRYHAQEVAAGIREMSPSRLSEPLEHALKRLDAIRSSTHHDAQDAGLASTLEQRALLALLADRDRLAADLQATRAELERVRRNHLRMMQREALDWADRMIWDIHDEWVLRNRPRLLSLASRIRAALATMEPKA